MNLPHRVTLQRATDGAVDDYGVPAQTWADLATARAFVQPKNARQLAELSQAGPVASTHNIYLDPNADVTEADRITFSGLTYQIDGIRDAAGLGHHLELDAHVVEYP